MMKVRFLVLFLFAAVLANAQTTVTIQPLRMGNLTTFNTSAIPTDYIQVEVGGKYGTYKRMVGDNTTPASDSVLVHTSGSRWKLLPSKSPSSTTWSNVTGKPTLYTSPTEVRNALSSLTGTNRLDTSAIKNLRGITTESDPLVGSHIKAITTQNITDWNASYRTGADVKSALEALTGTNRLDASAIKNLGSSPEFRVNGTVIASRPIFNLIAGSNITITGTDNSGANRVDVTISASGGSGGAVTSVAGRTGDVLLSKTDFGLGSVDNTSDMNKPVSTLQQAALDQRQQKLQFQENGTNKLGAGGAQQINIAGSGVSSTVSGSSITYNISSSGGASRHYVSPTDYGVDTTGVSDATTALQNMFNANPGGFVLFPKGRYRVNGTLTITSGSNEGNSLVIQGYGARIITSNAATTPVILFNNCMRVSVYGLQVDGTIDFDGWYFGNMQDCYLKDLRFGNQNLDAFDETYWSQWVNCTIKSTLAGIQIHTGLSSDLTEFNQNSFKECRIWYGNYAFAFYGTESAENVTLDNCDIGYQTIGKLYSQNTLNKASINLIGTYLDDDKGFPYDTKGIIVNTPVAGSVPHSANIGSFISDIASQANVNGYNGVRVGQRIPTSGYNLLKNGDIRYGVQEISSDWTSTTLTSGTGLFGQYIRFVASSASLPKTAEWTAIAAPISGWYSITVIGRNVDSTACVFASVVDGTEVLYNPVKIDDKTRFVVSTGKVYLTQGQVFKLRLYSQINVANTVDIAYVALSYGLTAQLYLPTHPDAISTPVVDNVTNLFEKGDGGTLSPDITSTSNVAAVVSSSGEDQTGDGTYIRFNPLTSADFPTVKFTLKSKYLKSAIRAGFVTFTARVKITSGYGSTMIAFGSDSAFVTPAQISTGTWQDWRITRAVPSGATKVQIIVTGAAAGTAKDIAFDAIQINLGKTATQWAMSPHDASSSGTVTGLTTVTNVAALKAITTGTNGQIVATAGYYTRGDGGHGQYVWNSTSTATADDGAVIQATGVTTGRWLLLYSSEINAKQYGAKGDYTTDDLLPLQAGIDFCVQKGLVFYLNGVVFTISNTLRIGTASPASLPSGENFTLRGYAPSFNWLASDASGFGTLIRLTGTGRTAAIDIKAGVGRYLRLQDFTVTCATEGGATYGIYWSQTAHSEHLLERVHSYRANRAFGIVRGGYANGEFITLRKCTGKGVTHFWFMDTDTGQSFNHLLEHCWGGTNDGGTLFEFGGSGLGFGFTAIEFNSSNAITFGSSTGVTFIKTNGISGIVNFIGGRLEGISQVLWSVQGTQNITGKFNFSGVHFDGMGSNNTSTRQFLRSTSSNSRMFVSFEDCRFTGIDPAAECSITLGTTDNSAYVFRRCDFGDMKTFRTVLSKTANGKVIFDDCQRKNQANSEILRFSKRYEYGYTTPAPALSVPENLLLQAGFSASTGASITATTPWSHAGTSSFYALYNQSNHLYSAGSGFQPYSTDANFRQAVLNTSSSVSQTISAMGFSTGSNEYRYRIILSSHAANNMNYRITLENSSTGTVYDQVQLVGFDRGIPICLDLVANDGNVGGSARIKFENLDGGNPMYINVFGQHAYTTPAAWFPSTLTTSSTTTGSFSLRY